MPRFFFHFQHGKSRLEDIAGTVLPDEEAAWFQAVRSARDMFGEDLVATQLHVEIEDENGRPVLDLPLAQVASVKS